MSGWLVLGISRLRSGAFRPLFDEQEKGAELEGVTIHRRFVSDSVSLFLIYFVQLAVMAMYLGQENLKLVPLLTVVFALGRWVLEVLWRVHADAFNPGPFVVTPQAGLLGGSRLRQQHSWIRVRPFVPAESRHDGREHLLHLHSRVHLQAVGGGRAQSCCWETEVLGIEPHSSSEEKRFC